MKTFAFKHQSANLEILCKLLNSVAQRYDCKFHYDPERSSIKYVGDEKYKRYIAEEVLSFFSNSTK